MGTPSYITPQTPGAKPWRAETLRARVIGAMGRLNPSTRAQVAEYTGDPRDQVDTQINELLVEGLIVPVLDRYRLKSNRERHEIPVTLHDGTVVGSWSTEWFREVEARSVLNLPSRAQRAAYLFDVRRRRGDTAANALEALVTSIYRANKATWRDD